MKILEKIEDVKREIRRIKRKDKKIGFVPTMGYLHEGHISLIRKAREECDYVVVSIFVNPTQFGPGEDYKRYPRDLNRDIKILKKEKVNLLFVPKVEDMYPKDFKTWVIVEDLSEKLEGKFRPSHFRGVCTVVLKLFNIVEPDCAYFGWKDAQQLVIVKKMVEDLNIPVEIIGCKTVREKDGLAASSRNTYLSEKDREKALCLYKALHKIKEMVELEGIRESDILLKEGKKIIENTEGVKLQYLEAVNLKNLNPVKKIKKGVMVAGAIKIGKVRLIDNIIF
ncbi:MAG: pantoate--beta-alanine ligase [Candidatus Omnitrophota bacterium]|nr:MAG: pantoate--beta-alanine ligase [Candidatus Omnitrophota bacterium]